MAIFNRKDEIQMMKLIGADKSFIRGPFLVEAMVYGFIAAVVATILGIVLLQAASPKLLEAGMNVQGTLEYVTTYMPIVMLAMIVLGGLIGVISSLLATQRYLKL
jgi:cell division transport system permease protein